MCFTETPYVLTWKLRFNGDEVKCEREFNVFFGPTKLPTLTGKSD